MNMPKGSKAIYKSQLVCREALECLVDNKVGLAAQLADLGWFDEWQKADALEWYLKKWGINVSEDSFIKLLCGVCIAESTLNKKWIARRQKCKKQKCKRRTRRPLTLKRK
jgi:hypothetical protein